MHDELEEGIRAFLIAHVRDGYAAGAAESLPDGTSRIRFEDGDVTFDDVWAGGDPFGGRTLLLVNRRPTWLCAFYGAVIDEDEDPWVVYGSLRTALAAAPPAFPVRGPAVFVDGPFRYQCTWDGGLPRFTGREWIDRGSRRVYEGAFVGGLVDRRGG